MRKRDILYMAAGLGLFGVAAGLVMAPDTVTRSLPVLQQFSELRGPLSVGLVGGAGVIVLLYALWSARPSGGRQKVLSPEKPPETPEPAGGDFVGEEVDEMIELGREEELRERFRESVEKVLDDTGPGSVEDGSWTDSRIAACFVNEELKYPLLERLRQWLESPDETLERRTRKTVDAMERLYGGEDGGG